MLTAKRRFHLVYTTRNISDLSDPELPAIHYPSNARLSMQTSNIVQAVSKVITIISTRFFPVATIFSTIFLCNGAHPDLLMNSTHPHLSSRRPHCPQYLPDSQYHLPHFVFSGYLLDNVTGQFTCYATPVSFFTIAHSAFELSAVALGLRSVQSRCHVVLLQDGRHLDMFLPFLRSR